MKVKVINQSDNQLPEYATSHAAGLDLRAMLSEAEELKPMERKLIHTGIYLELPIGCEAQVRPRSGLALKKGVTVLNSPGTIDADYRGEVMVLLINFSPETVTIENGERIAQLVVAKHERVEWQEVESLSDTSRGAGGYGHTGNN